MTNNQVITCIGCPLGCILNVSNNNGDIEVKGQVCKIGVDYAKEELTNPTRNITTSIKVEDGDIPMLSVKNSRAIPKHKIMDCVNHIHTIKVKAPIAMGSIVLKNVADTGVDFIATRKIEKK